MRFSDESEDPKVRLGMRDGRMKDVINRLAYKLPANDENSLIEAFRPIIKQQAKCFKHYEARNAELKDNLNDEVSDNARLEQELAEYFERKTTEDDISVPYKNHVVPRKRDFSKLNKKYDANDKSDKESQTVAGATHMSPTKIQQIKDKIKREDKGINASTSSSANPSSASSEDTASGSNPASDPDNPFTNNNSDPMENTNQSNSASDGSAESGDNSKPNESSNQSKPKKKHGFSHKINKIIHRETGAK